MGKQIYKLSKNNFAIIDYINLYSSNTNSIIITQTLDNTNTSSSFEMPFEIYGTKNLVPYIKEEEYCIVVRQKVDLTANNNLGYKIKQINKDIGKENYKDNVPYIPVNLPNGFIELKGSN